MIALDFLASFLIRVILFVASVLGVGFFAASETAFLSMNRWAVSKLADEGDKKARALCELVKDSGKTMSAYWSGRTFWRPWHQFWQSPFWLRPEYQGRGR